MQRILMVAKRGANYRHLDNIRRRGGLDAELRLAGIPPGIPSFRQDLLTACPLDEILTVHLACRRVKRPWLFSGALRFLYLGLVKAGTYWLFTSWVRRLQRTRPAAVVLWNGHRMPESAVRAAARFLHIRVIHIENGCLPNTRTVDPEGVNACNCLPRDPDFYRAIEAGDDHEWRLMQRDWHPAKKAPQDDDDRLPERFVFVPFQVDTDTQILLHSPWIDNMRQLFDVLSRVHARIRAAAGESGKLCFVLKEHPTSRHQYPELHERAKQDPGLVFRNNVSTQQLIEQSVAVMTINSTVGIEALLFGKTVITLGNAFYNLDGLVLHARDENELYDAVQAVPSFRPDEGIRRGLITHLCDSYAVPKDAARNGEDDWPAMAERIRMLSRPSVSQPAFEEAS